MRIKLILSECGNDFSAVMKCEHCQATHTINSGYHDNNYHTRVIPGMFCPKCHKNRIGQFDPLAVPAKP